MRQIPRLKTRASLPGNLSHDEVYTMLMLYRYQCKSCAWLAREFKLSHAQVRDIIGRRQVGGCCG